MESLRYFVTVLAPLLIIMDPLGNLGFFLAFTEGNTQAERRRIARIATAWSGLILAFFCLTGDFILRFFHITLPAFQLAGGFIFFLYALQLLQLLPTADKSQSLDRETPDREHVGLVPLATPLIAGPGAITAVLVQQQSSGGGSHTPILLGAIVVACLTVYCTFRFGDAIRGFLGVGGIRVATRLMGLLLAVIAVEFMVTGYGQIR